MEQEFKRKLNKENLLTLSWPPPILIWSLVLFVTKRTESPALLLPRRGPLMAVQSNA